MLVQAIVYHGAEGCGWVRLEVEAHNGTHLHKYVDLCMCNSEGLGLKGMVAIFV